MRREFSKILKAAIVNRSLNAAGQVVCEGCGLVLGKKKYDIDHIIPEAMITDKTVKLTAADGQLLGVACCHRGGQNKTAIDQGDIARAKRRERNNLGIKGRSTFACGRDSKFKKKVSGEVVLR